MSGALTPAQQAVMIALQALIVLAALQDLVQLRISNLLSVLIVLCFLGWLIVAGPHWSLWQNGVAFTVAFALGLMLFSRGLLGGGDVKLLAALALWFDLKGALLFVTLMALSGGVLALLLMAIRRMLPEGMTGEDGWALLRRRGPIPYGLAITAGALLAIHIDGVNPSPATTLQRLNDLMPLPG